ncbi:MAG TPA: ATP synthase F0 subunit B [bacterium]|nr:ATP synthase F0 subunit B [bacterium]
MKRAFPLILTVIPFIATAAEHAGRFKPEIMLLFALINFALFAGILVKLTGRKLSSFFYARERAIVEEFEKYQHTYEDAEREIAFLRRKVDGLPAEKKQLMETYERQAIHLYDDIMNNARIQAEFIQKEAERTLRDETDRCRANIVSDFIASLLAELKTRAGSLDESARRALVREFDRLTARPG